MNLIKHTQLVLENREFKMSTFHSQFLFVHKAGTVT